MKWLKRLSGQRDGQRMDRTSPEDLSRKVSALYSILAGVYGPERLVLKAGKLDALTLMKSSKIEERVLALQRLVYDDPSLNKPPARHQIPAVIDQVENELAELFARRTVEDELEKKVSAKMQERHEEYVAEIREQLLKEEGGPENPQTLKKLAELEKLDSISLARSAMEMMRPDTFAQIIGQERAVAALLSKIASPFPQHVILYGPPGVGKTTAARLALKEAKKLSTSAFRPDAPFVEVDGTTLRWDPREITNPLLGSVHDPIYQGARRDLADSGVPEPKPGLVTEAHGGILFIDEIGEMDPLLLNKLLKVLEDKRVTFESSYYDPSDPRIPQYIRKLFEEGAPADFILIGATTRPPEDLNPALRSRCAEIFFEPLTPDQIVTIVLNAAAKLKVSLDKEAADLIAEYTIEGRKAINLLADAYGLALYRQGGDPSRVKAIHKEDLLEVAQTARLSPFFDKKVADKPEVGKIFGLGVYGFLGSVLEIEAVAFPVKDEEGKGTVRFNDTAGSMAKDSVFNASSAIRALTGEDTAEYDLHVNVVGGGQIDGPSAGVAITVAIYSAIAHLPIPQDMAITGEVSLGGKVKPVGGVYEKIFGAKQAGLKRVLIPKDNEKDVPAKIPGIEVIPVSTLREVFDVVFGEWKKNG